MTVDLVGLTEIAERLEVKPQTVRMWRYRKQLPPPLVTLASGPVWDFPTIQQWYERRTHRR